MSIRNAFIHNLPNDEQIALLVENGYILNNGEPINSTSLITAMGNRSGGRIRDNGFKEIPGIAINESEEYVVLGVIKDIVYSSGEVPRNFAAVYRNGTIVWIATELLTFDSPSSIILSSTQNIQITFTPSTPMTESFIDMLRDLP